MDTLQKEKEQSIQEPIESSDQHTNLNIVEGKDNSYQQLPENEEDEGTTIQIGGDESMAGPIEKGETVVEPSSNVTAASQI